MEKIKREDMELLTKESILDKFMRLQDLFFEARDMLDPLTRIHVWNDVLQDELATK